MTLLKNILRINGFRESLLKHKRIPFNKYENLYSTTSSDKYVVEEIQIPIPSTGGHLAGKLWRSTKNSSGKPKSPIICMHGIQDNCGSFDPLIPLIIEGGMVLFAVDMPGHGLSSHTKELYYQSFFDGLSSIKRILSHFSWEKATLLGHSLGAVISFIFSGSFPQQVDRYIAMDNLHPVRRNDPTHGFQNVMNKMFEVERKILSEKVQRPSYTFEEIFSKTLESRKNTVTDEGCKILLKRGSEKIIVDGMDRYRFTHDIKTNIPAAFRFISEEQSENMATHIKCPICVIKGNPGEDYEPRENYLKMVDLLSKYAESLEFHLVPGTHHFHLNEPHLVAPIISKFLNS